MKSSQEQVNGKFLTSIDEEEKNAALFRSEELRSIISAIIDGVNIVGLDGKVIECNDAVLRMHGLSRDECLGKDVAEFFVAEDARRLAKKVRVALKKGLSTLEVKALKKDGTTFDAEVSISPLRDSSGKPKALVFVTRDITKWNKSKEEIRRQKERFEKYLNIAGSIILVLDSNGRIILLNKRGYEILGYKEGELVGKDWFETCLPEENREKLRDSFRKYMLGKIKAVKPAENPVLTKNGEKRIIKWHNALLKDDEGNIIGTLCSGEDITELKRKEEELQELFEFRNKVLDTAVVWIDLLDREGNVILWNRAAELISGYSREEVVGHKKIWEWLYPDPKYRAQIFSDAKRLIEGKTSIHNETTIRCKDGTLKIIRWYDNSIVDEKGEPVGSIAIGIDVTEQRKAEEELRRVLEFLNKVLDTAAVWITCVDLDWNVKIWNRAAELISGYSREEVVGHKKIWEWLYPDPEYREKLYAEFLEMIEKVGSSENYETVIRCKDGTLKTLSWYEKGILDENGKPVGNIAIAIDVTEVKKAREKLRESEEKYRNLFENARDVILVSDLKGTVTSVNKAVEEYGFKKEDIVGKNILEFVPEECRPKLLKKELVKIAKGEPVEGEVALVSPKGKRVAEYRSNPIKKGKEVVGAQMILRDITERKEMEEKLRQYSEQLEELVQERTRELLESERRYSVLVEEASDTVAILQDGKIVFVNKKGPEILGYSREEMTGLPFENLVDEKYRQLTRERYERRLRGEKVPSTYEIELVSKNGERVPVELSATRITYQGRPASLILVRDIRERKRMQEQLLKSERLAAIGRMATMVAHDLRNPLTSIRNASYYIKKNLPHTEKEKAEILREMLDIIEQETLFANDIVSDLLDFSTQRRLQKKRRNINEIIKNVLAKTDIPENVKVETKFAEEAVAPVDQQQLERVFLNLVKNAVQAMPKGGKLTIKTRETKKYVKITFKDTGVGIKEEHMPKLFTPFFTTKAKGIGLGLAICKKIVEQHGGKIEVKSKFGKGTTFTVTLPKEESKSEETNTVSLLMASTKEVLQTKRQG